jgi:hypothetical protein
MDLSVVVLKQVAASGKVYRPHKAANQFLWLHQQTRRVSVEVPLAPNLDIQLSVLLHQPAI